MYCKYCGNELEDSSLFCNKCGKAQAEPVQSSKKKKNKVKLSLKEKGIRFTSCISLIVIYLIAITTTIYLLAYGGGVVPGLLIFAAALVYQLTLFKKERIKAITNIAKNSVRRLVIVTVYFILPITLLVGSFEYSYYVIIGNSSAVAQRYVENTLKSNLKNPQSLQIHDIEFKNELEDKDNKYFHVEIEYSAQNSFGGYNRDTYIKYVQVVKNTGDAYEISQQEFKNKSIEIRDEKTEEKYGEKLLEISSNLYLNYMCDTNNKYSEIISALNSDDTWDIHEYKGGNQDGAVEITKTTLLDKFEGQILMYFEKNNQKLRRTEFLWAPDIVFYDKNNGSKRIGEHQTANIKDIEEIENLISSSLGVERKDVSGKHGSLYSNTYLWEISENIILTLEWNNSTEDDQAISTFLIKCLNDK